MKREWKPGEPVPAHYSGMPVTFAWNDVALTHLLSALRKDYPSGHAAMVDHIREAMANYTPPAPPKPEEPTGLGAVVEDIEGVLWIRADTDGMPWMNSKSSGDYWQSYADITAVRVLSEGVTE